MQAVEYALRVCESVAFSLHSLIGLTDPCHGIGREITADSLPVGFFPLAGICLAIVAGANFNFDFGEFLSAGDAGADTSSDWVVLAAQMFVVAFHSGAVAVHVLVRHHPAAGGAPGLFVLFAFLVTALRLRSFVAALLGTLVFAAVGSGLAYVLVRPGRSGGARELEDPLAGGPISRQ